MESELPGIVRVIERGGLKLDTPPCTIFRDHNTSAHPCVTQVFSDNNPIGQLEIPVGKIAQVFSDNNPIGRLEIPVAKMSRRRATPEPKWSARACEGEEGEGNTRESHTVMAIPYQGTHSCVAQKQFAAPSRSCPGEDESGLGSGTESKRNLASFARCAARKRISLPGNAEIVAKKRLFTRTRFSMPSCRMPLYMEYQSQQEGTLLCGFQLLTREEARALPPPDIHPPSRVCPPYLRGIAVQRVGGGPTAVSRYRAIHSF